MKRFIGPLALFLALITQPASAQNRFPSDEIPGGGATNGVWLGGPNSLPIGSGDLTAAIATARAMAAVRPIRDEFSRRGYMRLPDADVAILQSNYSVVVLAWSKPGWDPLVHQPVIAVTSKKVGSAFACQVYGGIVGVDANDSFRVYDDALDRAVVVAGTTGGGGSRRVLSPEGAGGSPDAAFVTAYDPASMGSYLQAQWSYGLYESTGYGPNVWGQYAEQVGSTAVTGGVGAFISRYPNPGWPINVTCGVILAWSAANSNFWATHARGSW